MISVRRLKRIIKHGAEPVICESLNIAIRVAGLALGKLLPLEVEHC